MITYRLGKLYVARLQMLGRVFYGNGERRSIAIMIALMKAYHEGLIA